MAKIKDLGINAIPLTMQPPAIGDGGGGGKDGDKDNAQYDTTSPGSMHANCCGIGDQGALTDNTTSPSSIIANCCDREKDPRNDKRASAAGFTPEAIAHVRQQIASQSANL